MRRDSDVFSELSEWWDAQRAPRQHPFLTSKMLGCWEDGFDEPSSKLNVVLLYRDSDLVAGLPLYRAGGRLRSLARAHAEPFDVVAVDDEEVTSYLPRWLGTLPMVNLYRVREGSPIMALMPGQPRWEVQATFNSTYVDLSNGMEAVRANMSTKYQRELRRRRRRLQEMGDLVLVEHSKPDGAQELLEAGLKLEARGWKGRNGIAVLRSPSLERWYRSVTEVALDQGWLRLCLLYLDDRLVAFLYNLEVDGHRLGMATAFDESADVSPLSPGSLLHESVLEASGAKLTSYRFGVGDDSWKYEWATGRDRVFDLVLFGSGAFGRGARRVWQTRAWMRSKAKDLSKLRPSEDQARRHPA